MTDPELRALFPTELSRQPLTITTLAGASSLNIDTTDPTGKAVLGALAAHSRSIDDLSVGSGVVGDGSAGVGIIGIRVRGTDISLMADELVAALLQAHTPERTAVQVAGKDVTSVTVTDQTAYVYPHNDVLWLVSAPEPALTEIFQKLP